MAANNTSEVLGEVTKTETFIIAGVYSCVFIVGVCGNLLVLGSLFIEKNLKFPGSPFLFNMTVVDLLNILVVFPVNLTNLVQMEQTVPDLACVIFGYFKAIFGKISIDSIAVLAFSRMVLVCDTALYQRMFKPKYEVVMLLAVWLHGILGSVSVELYGRPYTFEEKNLFCSYALVNKDSLIFGVLFWAMFIPLLFSGICYSITFAYVRKVQMRIAPNQRMSRNTGSKKLLATLVSSYICYFIFTLQYIIVVAIGVRGYVKINRLTYVITTWLGSTNYVTNSIVFGLTNSHFRNSYVKIFSKFFRFNYVSDAEETNNVRKMSNFFNRRVILDLNTNENKVSVHKF